MRNRHRTVAAALLVMLVTSVPAAAETLQPRIVNGVLSFGDPTTGALLAGGNPDQATAYCSGTLIGCSTFVTAAHCVCAQNGAACQAGAGAPDPGEWLVFFQHAGFFAVESIAVHPGFDFPSNDVAVLTLKPATEPPLPGISPAPVRGISPTPLAAADPSLGTEGTIVGFGQTSGSAGDYGLKQRGQVVTAACGAGLPGGLVCWNFESPLGAPGSDSNTCNGDSGGPLFVDDAGTRTLAGITSGGEAVDCLPVDRSYDTSVFVQRTYIEAEGGADLASATCSADTLSQVGDAVTQVVGFSDTLTSNKPEARHSFDVGADLAELRVALNASEATSGDVDLYVRFGTPPTLSEWDCRAFGANQWGFCGFPNPQAGTWYVLVRRFAGESTYQVTATIFAGEGAAPPPPAVAGVQTRAQRRCLNGLAEAGARVSRAQAQDTGSCLHAFSRSHLDRLGRDAQPRTAEACLSNDVDGDVAVALERTLRRDARRCLARPEQLPDFAYRSAGPVNGGARAEARELVADLFGPELDATLALASSAPVSARCQEDVAEAANDLLSASVRYSVSQQRKVLRGGNGRAPVASATALAARILEQFPGASSADLPYRRAGARLGKAIRDRCAATEGDLTTLFPGVCASAEGTVLLDCVQRRAHCRACRSLNAMLDLAIDCDLFDDRIPDLTCS